MKIGLLLLVLGFITSVSYAQSDSTKRQAAGAIEYSRPTYFKSGKFSVNGERVSLKEVNSMLGSYQPAAVEYDEYKKYRNLTYYSGGTAVALIVASLIATGGANTFKNTSSKVLFGAGCAFIVPEYIFGGKCNRHFKHAAEIYNQQFN